jgi:hypothetical protein
MILYVNGDSHTAGAEAVNPHCFAKDDPLYWKLGRLPHPDNEKASYGCELANMLHAVLQCDAESASSNDRIIRTTYDYIDRHNKPDLIIIGWSTWEREEWWHEGTQQYWQVNAGGIGSDWPDEIKERYRPYISNMDYNHSVGVAHEKIYRLHNYLELRDINHIFFNTFLPFANVSQLEWSGSYIEPYNPTYTYYNWLKAQGFTTVNPDSYHFGPRAHSAWAEFLYQNYVLSILTK